MILSQNFQDETSELTIKNLLTVTDMIHKNGVLGNSFQDWTVAT